MRENSFILSSKKNTTPENIISTNNDGADNNYSNNNVRNKATFVETLLTVELL